MKSEEEAERSRQQAGAVAGVCFVIFLVIVAITAVAQSCQG